MALQLGFLFFLFIHDFPSYINVDIDTTFSAMNLRLGRETEHSIYYNTTREKA